MTLTADIIAAEIEQLKQDGVDQLPRDRGEYVRAAKAYLDCVTMIQKFGPLPDAFIHGGWPWARQDWNPSRYDAGKNVLKAAALMALEYERLEEQTEVARQRHQTG
jgi:hypothetical protein